MEREERVKEREGEVGGGEGEERGKTHDGDADPDAVVGGDGVGEEKQRPHASWSRL